MNFCCLQKEPPERMQPRENKQHFTEMTSFYHFAKFLRIAMLRIWVLGICCKTNLIFFYDFGFLSQNNSVHGSFAVSQKKKPELTNKKKSRNYGDMARMRYGISNSELLRLSRKMLISESFGSVPYCFFFFLLLKVCEKWESWVLFVRPAYSMPYPMFALCPQFRYLL